MRTEHRRVILATFVFLFTLGGYGYVRYTQEKESMNQTINAKLNHAVGSATLIIGDALHDHYSMNPPSEAEDMALIKELSVLANELEVVYIYSMIVDENNTLHFTSSSAKEEELRSGDNLTRYGDTYDPNEKIFRAMRQQSKEYDWLVEDQWGKFRSLFAGHMTPNHHRYVIGADVDVSAIDRLSREAALRAVLESLILLLGALPLLLSYRYVMRQHQKQLREEVVLATEALHESRDEAVRAMQKAQDANSAKDKFLASMSHELRTPLNAINGFSQILLAKNDLSDGSKKMVDSIYTSGKSLLELVNTILDFAKIESGTVEITKEDFQMGELLAELSSMMEPLLSKKELRLGIDNSIESIHADRTQIKQVLINLLSNAIKFSPEQSEITIRCTKDAKTYQIAVSDQGIGIPKEYLATLFDPFVQVREHQKGSIKGTGLGLALVKKVIEMHGGNIELESEEGKGSCFSFSLPL